MPTLNLKEEESNVVVGLGTFQRTVTVAGFFLAKAFCTETPVSGLTITINLNGSPVNSATVVSPVQQELNVRADYINCSVGDVINFVISSSTANDEMLNTVKTILVVTRQG